MLLIRMLSLFSHFPQILMVDIRESDREVQFLAHSLLREFEVAADGVEQHFIAIVSLKCVWKEAAVLALSLSLHLFDYLLAVSYFIDWQGLIVHLRKCFVSVLEVILVWLWMAVPAPPKMQSTISVPDYFVVELDVGGPMRDLVDHEAARLTLHIDRRK